MKSSIKLIVTFLTLALVLVGCKDQNSVQTYFVDHQELPDFMSFDYFYGVVDFSKANLTKRKRKRIKSVIS